MMTIDEAESWLKAEVMAWPESVAIANAAYPPPEGWIWMGEDGDVILVCRPSSGASAVAQAAWGEANALGREVWTFKEGEAMGDIIKPGTLFHIRRGGRIQYQGAIDAMPREGVFKAQFFSCMDGRDTSWRLVTLEKIVSEEWEFYDDEEEFLLAMRNDVQSRMSERDGKAND